jgi:hypothetical protein
MALTVSRSWVAAKGKSARSQCPALREKKHPCSFRTAMIKVDNVSRHVRGRLDKK